MSNTDTTRDAPPNDTRQVWRVVFDPMNAPVELRVEVEPFDLGKDLRGFTAHVADAHGPLTLRAQRGHAFRDTRDVRHRHSTQWADSAVLLAAVAEGVVFRELLHPGQMSVREMREAFRVIAALDWVTRTDRMHRRPYMADDDHSEDTAVHSAPEVRLLAAGMIARSCVGLPVDGSGDAAANIHADLARYKRLPERANAAFPTHPRCPVCGCKRAMTFGEAEEHTDPRCIPF